MNYKIESCPDLPSPATLEMLKRFDARPPVIPRSIPPPPPFSSRLKLMWANTFGDLPYLAAHAVKKLFGAIFLAFGSVVLAAVAHSLLTAPPIVLAVAVVWFVCYRKT